MTYIYIVHGFGAFYAFTTRKKARAFRDYCRPACEISRVELR